MKDYFKDLFDSFIFSLLFLGIIVFICFICFSLYEVLILKNMNVLGFFGSVIGGSLTLIGVWWTIKDQDKKRKEDLAIQYLPIFETYIADPIITNDLYRIEFQTKNIGRGEVLSGYFKENEIIFNGTTSFVAKIIDNRNVYIPIDKTAKFTILINKDIFQENLAVESYFVFLYTDIFSNKKAIEINIKLIKDNDSLSLGISSAILN